MSNLQNFLKEYEKIAVPDDQIDLSDCPEQTPEELAEFRPLYPKRRTANSKPVIIRMNPDLADHLQAIGDGWESKVNDVLMNAYAMGQI